MADRIMIGFNGTSVAATTNRVANPLLQDVNKGWLQYLRDNAPERVLTEGETAGKVVVGATGGGRPAVDVRLDQAKERRQVMATKQALARIAVAALTLSAAGFATWTASEGDGPTSVRADGAVVHHPYVPTKGDVPTIGHGSTRYEDGTPVRLTDAPITRQRAQQLARNLHSEEEARFKPSLPGVMLYPGEFDLYLDFVGQYGIGNWRKPQSPRTWLLQGDHLGACQALLQWRFQARRDCRLPQNWGPKGCKGVWTRQQKRHADCLGMQ